MTRLHSEHQTNDSGNSTKRLALSCINRQCRGALTARLRSYECKNCGATYPIIDSVPCFLPDEYDRSINERYERDGAEIEEVAAAVGYQFNRQHALLSKTVQTICSEFPASGSILDVGCGHGHLTANLVPSYEVYGVDLAHAMLKRAKNEGLSVFQADAMNLPFANAAFDVVVCAEMVQHFEKLDIIAAELGRVVRPGGAVVVTTLNKSSLLRTLFRAFSASSFYPLRRHAKELVEPFERAGLRCERITWTHFPFDLVRQTSMPVNVSGFLASNIILTAKRPQI